MVKGRNSCHVAPFNFQNIHFDLQRKTSPTPGDKETANKANTRKTKGPVALHDIIMVQRIDPSLHTPARLQRISAILDWHRSPRTRKHAIAAERDRFDNRTSCCHRPHTQNFTLSLIRSNGNVHHSVDDYFHRHRQYARISATSFA